MRMFYCNSVINEEEYETINNYFSVAEEYASQINAIFIETSALTAVNVPELFMKIGKPSKAYNC